MKNNANLSVSWRSPTEKLGNLTVQVLTEEERHRVHQQSLELLAKTGVRVDTARGRAILCDAGALVEDSSHIVRFPTNVVEEALRLAPRRFNLGGRRPGWQLEMNTGHCTLLADGGAMFVVDAESGERRTGTHQDWLKATHLLDVIEEIGVYWWMVQEPVPFKTMGDVVGYWVDVFTNFSKHVQDSTEDPKQTRWMLEVLDIVFGGRDEVSKAHPLSFLLCPLSPLAIEGQYTDAYLETLGWQIPVAAMPMPLMGTTAPGRLIATTVQGNCEVLAMLCLVQAAAPGTPFIYAPALAVIEPRTGRYTGGAVEHALLGVAATEMARYYGLPVEASTGGTDTHMPGIQAAYERAINWSLPVLGWPDVLVGPGLLDGSTVMSFEQLILDMEVYRRTCRLYQGINTREEAWLLEEIACTGPGGNYLARRSTRDALRDKEWHISSLGEHDSYENWLSSGKPCLITEVRARIDELLEKYEPRPLERSAQRELELLRESAVEHKA
jgi:trimethylamine--corrinoid protein Co-methyltransferase